MVVTQVSNLVDMVVQGLASYLGEILLWGVTSYRSWCTIHNISIGWVVISQNLHLFHNNQIYKYFRLYDLFT